VSRHSESVNDVRRSMGHPTLPQGRVLESVLCKELTVYEVVKVTTVKYFLQAIHSKDLQVRPAW